MRRWQAGLLLLSVLTGCGATGYSGGKWIETRYSWSVRRWGVRANYIAPAGEEKTPYEAGIGGGIFWLPKPRGKLLWELGFDYAQLVSEDESMEDSLFIIRSDGLYCPQGVGLYGLGGLQVLIESAYDKVADETNTYWSVDLNAGVGWRSPQKRLDIRATYSLLLGSDNVQGIVTGAIGLLF